MLSSLLLLSLATLGAAHPTTPVTERQTSVYQIRGVVSPIFHLYLQGQPGAAGIPVMGPEATGEFFTVGSTIQSQNTSLYLNIGTNTASYLPLTFDATARTTAWGLEGDTIITKQSSSYGRQLNFLACESATAGYYNLYLQTGSDVPSGRTCSNYQTIHLPCLC